MTNYQDQLRQLGWEGLGLKGVVHPRAKKGDNLESPFAGAASCKQCHPTAWGVWSKTKHAKATETLTKIVPGAPVGSRMHQLPFHGLEPAGVFRLCRRFRQREHDTTAGQQFLRELPRPLGRARGRGKRAERREARRRAAKP